MGPEGSNHRVGEGFRGPQIRPRYTWNHNRGDWLLFWEGNVVATVTDGGKFSVTWRGHQHSGFVRSAALARKFIDRWLAARPPLPPLQNKDLPPKALASLESFLREQQDGFEF